MRLDAKVKSSLYGEEVKPDTRLVEGLMRSAMRFHGGAIR